MNVMVSCWKPYRQLVIGAGTEQPANHASRNSGGSCGYCRPTSRLYCQQQMAKTIALFTVHKCCIVCSSLHQTYLCYTVTTRIVPRVSGLPFDGCIGCYCIVSAARSLNESINKWTQLTMWHLSLGNRSLFIQILIAYQWFGTKNFNLKKCLTQEYLFNFQFAIIARLWINSRDSEGEIHNLFGLLMLRVGVLIFKIFCWEITVVHVSLLTNQHVKGTKENVVTGRQSQGNTHVWSETEF